jgi:hypothetical protein
MLYLSPASSESLREAMRRGEIGWLTTPRERRLHIDGVTWAADNGCFGQGYPGDDAYLKWLDSRPREQCLWATAPDVVGDAAATLTRSLPMLPRIRALGYRAALVAQDGLEDLEVPWAEFDVLFVGGSTEWKLSPAAAGLCAEAKARGMPVHVGRVNSHRRLRHAALMGADTADGTFVTFAPNVNLPRMRVWLRRLEHEPVLPWA